jgi:methionyl-tRNA synthetase
LRQVWLHLYPFFPEKMSEMFEKLGLEWYSDDLQQGRFKELLDKKEIFHIKEKGKPLFQRIEV